MTSKIIPVVNQKGGPGKTTVAVQVAAVLARRGFKVMLVDADPQGTATRWVASAEEGRRLPLAVSGLAAAGAMLHREVRQYVSDYDAIVIDCPPAVDSPIPKSALLVADLALVPVIPAPSNLWATQPIVELIQQVQALNESLKAMLVVNQLGSGKIMADSSECLGKLGLPVARSYLRHRVAHMEAMALGGVVHDTGPSGVKAAKELDALVDEIAALLWGVVRKAA